MSTLKVSTISPLGTDATKTITIGASGDVAAGVFTNVPAFQASLSANQSLSASSITTLQFHCYCNQIIKKNFRYFSSRMKRMKNVSKLLLYLRLLVFTIFRISDNKVNP